MYLPSKKIKLSKIISFLKLKLNLKKDCLIKNVSNIDNSLKNDITLCMSSKYIDLLKKTKASACITSKNFLHYVPKNCFPIISGNPQIDFIKVSNLFYGDYVIDKISKNYLNKSKIKKKFKKFFFGENFVCEKNVRIGKNVNIGHNVLIKENCIIGDNVNIGCNVIISNSVIKNNVNICDGTVIGKKGFGFKFL